VIVIVTQGAVTAAELDDLRRFHVEAAEDVDVGGTLRAAGWGDGAAGDHAWVSIAALRGAAAGAVPASWQADFDAMVAFAASKGWVDAAGTHLQGHVVRV
jgi:hypothetical protein